MKDREDGDVMRLLLELKFVMYQVTGGARLKKVDELCYYRSGGSTAGLGFYGRSVRLGLPRIFTRASRQHL